MMDNILNILHAIEKFIQSNHFDISIFQNLFIALLTILIPISLYILQEKDFSFEWEKLAIIDKIIKFKELISYTIIFFLSLLLIKIDISIFIFSYLLIIISIYKVLKIITNSLKWILDIYGGDFRFNIRKKYIEKLPYDKKLDFWKMTWSKDILDSRFEKFLLNNFFGDSGDLDKLYKNKNLDLYRNYLKIFSDNFLNKLNSSIDKSISDKKDHLYLIDFNWQIYLEKTITHHKTLSISSHEEKVFDGVNFYALFNFTHSILSKSYLYPIYINDFFNIMKEDPSIFKETYPEIFYDFFKAIMSFEFKPEEAHRDFYLNTEHKITLLNYNEEFQQSIFNNFTEYIKNNYIRPLISFGYYPEKKSSREILENILKIWQTLSGEKYTIDKKIILFDFILILKISDFIISQKEFDTKLLKDLYQDLSKNVYITDPTIVYIGDSDPSRKEEIQYTRQILSAFCILNDTFKNSMQNLKNSKDEKLKKIYNRLEDYLD